MKNLLKKILVTCGIIGIVSATASFTTSQSVSAYGSNCRPFLGMVSWDCNVIENPTDDATLKSNIWAIAINIAVDITVIAAYLVLGYVIYGGYLYTFSGGDPGKVATGRKTLVQAFTGLAIVLTANIILNSIGIALNRDFVAEHCIEIQNAGATNVTYNTNCYNSDTAPAMISGMLQWVIGIAGLVSAIFVVYGGISYMTSAGDPNKLKKAKDIILYALIGLAIVALAEIIVIFISNTITESTSSYIKPITTLKENP